MLLGIGELMGDFFTRLAERALGLTSTIQPVLPTVFAPVAPLSSAVLDTEVEDAVEQPAPHSRSPRGHAIEASNDQPPNPQQAMPITPIEQHSARPLQITSATNAPSTSERRAFIPTIAQQHPLRPISADGHAPAPTAAIEQEHVNNRSTSVVSVDEHDEQHTSGSVAARPPDAATGLHIAQERTPLVPKAPAMPSVQRVAAPTVPVAAPLAPKAPKDGTPAAQAAPRGNEHLVEAPPTRHIHVSIGRIDVRAVPLPAPAVTRPAAPSGPKMSLDDYLRAQKDGRR